MRDMIGGILVAVAIYGTALPVLWAVQRIANALERIANALERGER